jgi:ribosomal-protein-alanine N-acetyltransferase
MPLIPPVLEGRGVTLRPFDAAQISPRYLSWLTDPEVNKFSQRIGRREISADEAAAYLRGLGKDEHVLGIHTGAQGHVGNIKYGPVDWTNLRADISILIGERSVWGQGVGAAAMYLVTRFLFEEAGLNRVDAGSNNPAFLRMVEKLGWSVEGVLRDRVKTGDGYRDHTLVALLARDFAARTELEASARQTAGKGAAA